MSKSKQIIDFVQLYYEKAFEVHLRGHVPVSINPNFGVITAVLQRILREARAAEQWYIVNLVNPKSTGPRLKFGLAASLD